jgi:hypothetical protein
MKISYSTFCNLVEFAVCDIRCGNDFDDYLANIDVYEMKESLKVDYITLKKIWDMTMNCIKKCDSIELSLINELLKENNRFIAKSGVNFLLNNCMFG